MTTALGFFFGAASSPAADLAGTVSDAFGKGALPGATVTVVGKNLAGSTDSGGRFRFTDLPEGTYTLSVGYVGYEAKTETVRVPAAGLQNVAITLGG